MYMYHINVSSSIVKPTEYSIYREHTFHFHPIVSFIVIVIVCMAHISHIHILNQVHTYQLYGYREKKSLFLLSFNFTLLLTVEVDDVDVRVWISCFYLFSIVLVNRKGTEIET